MHNPLAAAAERAGPITVVLIPSTGRYWVWDARRVVIARVC